MKSKDKSPVKIVPQIKRGERGSFSHAMYVNNKLFSDEIEIQDGQYYCEGNGADQSLILPLRISDIPDNFILFFFNYSVCREIETSEIEKRNGEFIMQFWVTDISFKHSNLNFRKFVTLLHKKIKKTNEITSSLQCIKEDDEEVEFNITYTPKCPDTTTIQQVLDKMTSILEPIYFEVVKAMVTKDKELLKVIKEMPNNKKK